MVYTTRIFTLASFFILFSIFSSSVFAQTSPPTSHQGPIENNSNNIRQFCTSYRSYGPFVARAVVLQADQYQSRVGDLEFIKNNPTTCPQISDYRIAFGSVATMQQLLTPTEITRLRNIGVTTLMYNPEGGHTPLDEFNRRNEDSPDNPIVQLGQFAQINGFDSIWVPLRGDADTPTDAVLTRIYQSGVDGLGLQEQRFIEVECVADRFARVRNTVNRHETQAGKQLEVTVQLMSTRCTTGDSLMASCGQGTFSYQFQHCDTFIDRLDSEYPFDILAVWPTTNETPLISTLRAGSLTPTSTPTRTPTQIPPNTLTRVDINLPFITTSLDGKPVALSALAYDAQNRPMFSGVTYEWGISSTNSIGTVEPSDQNVASFTGLNPGTGDLFVTARHNGVSVTKSIAVSVTLPTPTPTPFCQHKNKGDADCNNRINLSDLSVVLTLFGRDGTNGDTNNDGRITLVDLSILLSNFGKSF